MAKTTETTKTEEQTEETPSYMTAEAFNAAMTARDKRLEKKLQDLLTPLVARISDLQTKTEEPTEEKKSEGENELAKRLKAMEDALKASEKARAEQAAEAEKVRKAAELADTRSKVATALRDAGISNPALAKAALAYFETEGKVIRDESGAVKMRQVDKYGVESALDLAEGITAWTKSDEGAAFMPARQVAGSGSTGGSKFAKPGMSKKEQGKAEALELLATAFGPGGNIE